MTSTTLYPTIKQNVRTIGIIARLSIVDSRLFHNDEAERISEALRRAMRQITDITLTSETPMVEKVLTTDDVVLRVLVVLNVLLTVLNVDDNIQVPPTRLASSSTS
jgi:hypothetical protein